MLFNSYEFVFVFLPLFVAGFYTVSYIFSGLSLEAKTGKKAFAKPACAQSMVELYCVILSFIFFAFFGIKVLGVFLISLIWNGIFLRLIQSRQGLAISKSSKESDNYDHHSPKSLLVAGICGNVILLLFFKYAGFFADIINFFGKSSITVVVLLPIAISFYTFSQISLLVDVYKREVTDITLLDYLFYITFFPKLLQGPIVRFVDIRSSLEKSMEHRWNVEDFMQAVMLFVLGLSKKVIIADTLAVAVDYGYSNLSTLTRLDAILTAICYSLQIYFDFSGYCDMGKGICRMVGMDLPVNFNSPYKARNIDYFWKRWHITLTKFFTKYVYIPLGGNRKGAFRTYLNFMIIFVLSGFWHGAGLTFIIWGALHGILYVITRVITNRTNNTKAPSRNAKKMLPSPVAIILTFIFVTFAWVFFRADSLSDATTLIYSMVKTDAYNTSFFKISSDFIECFQIDELWYIFKITPIAAMSWGPSVCMWIIIVISGFFAFVSPSALELTDKHKVNVKGAIILASLFVWSVIKFANVSTYIYLGF